MEVVSIDPAHTADAIRTFGETPLKVATPSGGLHLYYRYAGEQRSIRPFGKTFPLDVLGNGLAVVPPSCRPATDKKAPGDYRVLEGDLESAGPPSRNQARRYAPAAQTECCGGAGRTKVDLSTLREGDGRDVSLFDRARAIAMSCGMEADLVTALLHENAAMA